MYEQLGDGSYANTKQLTGYVTLLALWIYEHFLTIGHRQLQDDYVEDEPWCMEYVVGSRLSTLASVRMQLDSIYIGVVQWMSYEKHRAVRPFKWIALFSGYIRFRACKQMHLPERVLRKFGYIQCIPPHPTTVHHGDPSTSEIDLLVLYALSIINTMLKAFNNFTESGCVQNKFCTTFIPS